MREKLIELEREATDHASDICIDHRDCEDCPGRKYGTHCRDYLKADYLISNGVTVQKWISQTELPWMGEEIAKLCIRYMEDYVDFYCYTSSKKVKAHIVRLLELEKDGRIAIMPKQPAEVDNG